MPGMPTFRLLLAVCVCASAAAAGSTSCTTAQSSIVDWTSDDILVRLDLIQTVIPSAGAASPEVLESCRFSTLADHFGDYSECAGASPSQIRAYYRKLASCMAQESRGDGGVFEGIKNWVLDTRARVVAEDNLPMVSLTWATVCKDNFDVRDVFVLLGSIQDKVDGLQDEVIVDREIASEQHNALQAKHDAAMRQIEEKYNAIMRQMEEKHNATVRNIEGSHNATVREIKEQHNATRELVDEKTGELAKVMRVAIDLFGGFKPWPAWLAVAAVLRAYTRKKHRMAPSRFACLVLFPVFVRVYQVGFLLAFRVSGTGETASVRRIADVLPKDVLAQDVVDYIGSMRKQVVELLSGVIGVSSLLEAVVAIATAVLLLKSMYDFSRSCLGSLLSRKRRRKTDWRS